MHNRTIGYVTVITLAGIALLYVVTRIQEPVSPPLKVEDSVALSEIDRSVRQSEPKAVARKYSNIPHDEMITKFIRFEGRSLRDVRSIISKQDIPLLFECLYDPEYFDRIRTSVKIICVTENSEFTRKQLVRFIESTENILDGSPDSEIVMFNKIESIGTIGLLKGSETEDFLLRMLTEEGSDSLIAAYRAKSSTSIYWGEGETVTEAAYVRARASEGLCVMGEKYLDQLNALLSSYNEVILTWTEEDFIMKDGTSDVSPGQTLIMSLANWHTSSWMTGKARNEGGLAMHLELLFDPETRFHGTQSTLMNEFLGALENE